MDNGQSIEVEEQLLELLQRARRDGPEGENAAEIVQSTAIVAVQRVER